MLTAHVNIGGVLRAFERLKRTDTSKAFRAAKKPARKDQRDHAKRQASAQGRWPGLADTTRARRARGAKRKSRKILGRLPAALQITSGKDFVRVTSRVPWSGVHQDGGAAGKNARIPRRQFLWISKDLLRAVRDIFTAALDRAWQGG